MRRRDFLSTMGGLAGGGFAFALPLSASASALPGTAAPAAGGDILGMYVHQHWPYNHPYCARTWTVEDYRGYADGLSKLGYNTIMIWPVLETMPSPLTPSDRANLEKLSKVVDVLHHEFNMRVWLALCPNIVANNAEASKYTFEKRHFFYCDRHVNPGDPAALKQMIDWREQLLRPLAQVDAMAIIDSDPGGYPGSTNEEFVNLLGEHRKMFNRLRPGIELYYWMHAGWLSYCRYYQTGVFKLGTPEEAADVLTRLKQLDPEPWGITVNTLHPFYPPPDTTHFAVASKLGLQSKAVGFSYGAIEAEPSFPMTNFGGDAAFDAGKTKAPRGVVGNAQTHCVQLPNTFAFAQGAQGRPVEEANYLEFAHGLIPHQGQLIVKGWEALAGENTEAMRGIADQLAGVSPQDLAPGHLKGLLFGDPHRFIIDLARELRLKAAFDDFVAASKSGGEIKAPFQYFVAAADAMQKRWGYECAWRWPGLSDSLKKLKSPSIDAILDEKGEGSTPFDRVENHLKKTETFTTRLIAAMKTTAATL